MRPSMRVPLREAKFICSSCRPVSTPRVSPLGQFRQYASDSPGLLERTRRKLWGTDSPPGQADPYSGSQIMPRSDLSPPEKPADQDFNLTHHDSEEAEIDNLNWEELPTVGYLPQNEWKIKGPQKSDQVEAWYANNQPLTHSQAVHHAAVQVALAHIAGKNFHTLSGINLTAFSRGIQQCRFEGEAGNWGDRLRFPSANVMDILIREVAGPNVAKPRVNSILSALSEAGDNHPAVYKSDSNTKVQNTIDSLSLADGRIKFALVSLISKLTSQRVSDSVVSSSTVGEVKSTYKELLKKTARSNPVILHQAMDKKGAAELANIKIFDVRQTRHDSDEASGRKKAIVSALYTNGLIKRALVPKKPKDKWLKQSTEAKNIKKSLASL